MEGGNYFRGKRGMSIIAEAIEYLQILAFLQKTESSQYENLFETIVELQTLFQEPL